MAAKIDISTLNWVKGEIDETLKQARIALEAYVEEPEDETQIRFCVNYLHQVRGTLQMVELEGAALAAIEMEQLADAMQNGQVDDHEKAGGVLMRAILQLPDYLESLLAGRPDSPLALGKLLNDLRAIQGKGQVAEESLFWPDLSVMPPTAGEPPVKGKAQAAAKKLRPHYQANLVKVLQGKDTEQGLRTLAAVIIKLNEVIERPALQQWLWVTEGFLDALRDGSVELDKLSKQLLSKSEQVIKSVGDGGEDRVPLEGLEKLTATELYKLAYAKSSSQRIQELKTAFRLDELIPQTDDGKSMGPMGGFNAELKQTVAADILEELSRVKDTLDVFDRAEERRAENLQPMADILARLANTLSVVGQDDLRALLLQQVESIQKVIAQDEAPDNNLLMGIASAVLAVEAAISDWGVIAPLEAVDDQTGQVAKEDLAPEAEAEHQRVVRQVMKEAKGSLMFVKEAIDHFLENINEPERLDKAPGLLYEIIGSLSMLSYTRAARVLQACRFYITEQLVNVSEMPDEAYLDALADVITSVEYYLDAFVESRVHPASALDVAERAVAVLGYPVESIDERLAQEAEAQAAEEAAAEVEEPGAAEQGKVELELVESSPVEVEPEPIEIEEAPAEEAPAAPAAPESVSSVADELDDEILEIFVEEVEEELERINELLPKWQASTSDSEALLELRRSFHTLKGSGRLVGASIIGEFAWAFENLLNRVIDNTISAGAALFDIMDQAREALPQLLEQFKGGAQPSVDYAALESMAHAMSTPGGEAEVAAPAAAPEPETAEAEEVIELAEESAGGMDPQLLEIYSRESSGHLETIEQFLTECQAADACKVTEPLIRALHTLRGSSHMAQVEPVASVSGELERYVKDCSEDDRPVTAAGLHTLAHCVSYTREVITALTEDSGELPDNGELLSACAALFEETEEPQAEALVEPEEPAVEESHEAEAAVELEEPAVEESLAAVTAEAPVAEEQETAPPEAAPAVHPELIEPTSSTDYLDDYDEELIDIFLEEGVEILDASEQTLQDWVDHPDDQSLVAALQRQLHTLKGSARMAGVAPIGDLSHHLESVFESVVEGTMKRSREMTDLMQLAHDRLVTMLEQVRHQEPVIHGDDLIAQIMQLGSGGAAPTLAEAPAALEPSEAPIEPAAEEAGVDLSEFEFDESALSLDEPEVEAISLDEGEVSDEDLAMFNFVEEQGQATEAEQAAEPELEPEPEIELVAEPEAEAEPEPEPEPEPEQIIPEQTPFVSSALASLADIQQELAGWMRDAENWEIVEGLQQKVSALSGLANEEKVGPLMELNEQIDSIIMQVKDGHVPVSRELFSLMQLSCSRIEAILEQVDSGGELPPVDDLVTSISDMIARSQPPEPEVPVESAAEKAARLEKEKEEKQAAENRRQGARIQHEMVRVRADVLDNMVNYAGEVSIYRSRTEQQMGAFRSHLDELDQTVERLREQLRKFDIETEAQIQSRYDEAASQGYEEFDPLEFDRFTTMQQISRSMMESLSDLVSLEDILGGLTRESETLLLQQARVNTELQEGLMQTRMVPLVENAPRLRRIVRQTSAELNKQAELRFSGAEVEMDRNVVERMMAPLEHMLRNSIAHGIEKPAARKKAGKPEVGTIRIALSREGSEIVIRVIDDGGGISLASVRKKAIDRGLMKKNSDLSDKEIIHFIMESGFSTAESLSQIAGRGVGMDVVASEIKQLGGNLEIDTIEGKGTTFIIRLPLTLSVSRALLVNVGDSVYAVPLLSIMGVERIPPADLKGMLEAERPVYNWLDQEYDLLNLGRILGVPGVVLDESGKRPLLFAQSGDHHIALVVDELIGSREIVVKSLGPQLSTLQGLSGATILGDGSVALILDLPMLSRLGLAQRERAEEIEHIEEVATLPKVLIVDDSITVRKVTSRVLERNDLIPMTAKDGVDAIAVLEEGLPDVILLDVEMPRMDGYEFATHVRNTERLKDIPIIMITSRSGEKHRQRAMDIGVNLYMSKPFQESELLENINSLVNK